MALHRASLVKKCPASTSLHGLATKALTRTVYTCAMNIFYTCTRSVTAKNHPLDDTPITSHSSRRCNFKANYHRVLLQATY